MVCCQRVSEGFVRSSAACTSACALPAPARVDSTPHSGSRRLALPGSFTRRVLLLVRLLALAAVRAHHTVGTTASQKQCTSNTLGGGGAQWCARVLSEDQCDGRELHRPALSLSRASQRCPCRHHASHFACSSQLAGPEGRRRHGEATRRHYRRWTCNDPCSCVCIVQKSRTIAQDNHTLR